MRDLVFEWDPHKSRTNKAKHGISFEEAQTVFLDENARFVPDPDHSEAEDRFILLGFSYNLRLLIVCYCYRSSQDAIRIISARKATRNEANWYFA